MDTFGQIGRGMVWTWGVGTRTDMPVLLLWNLWLAVSFLLSKPVKVPIQLMEEQLI